jgi:hypothetical protein
MGRFYRVNEHHGNLLTCVFAEKHGKMANPLVAVDCSTNVDRATAERPQLVLKALHWGTVDTAVSLDRTLAHEAALDYALSPPSG